MTEYVSDVMTRSITTVSVDSTVADAENRMLKYGRRCVPVIDDENNVFGVLSSVDIHKQRTNDANLHSIRVWEICSHVVFSVQPEMPVDSVIDVMLQNNVHHILVVGDKKAAGIVSVLDIIQLYREKLSYSADAARELPAERVESDTGVKNIYKL